MSFSPIFSISQTATNPRLIIAEDLSTGSDAAIAGKRITFTTDAPSTLVVSGTTTSYNLWATAENPKSFNVLAQDYALSILVEWVNVSGTTLYSSTQSYCLAYFNKQNFYYLLQQQALAPSIVQDANYYSNLAMYWANIIGAVQAIEIGNDLSASQNCLNRATAMMNSESLNF